MFFCLDHTHRTSFTKSCSSLLERTAPRGAAHPAHHARPAQLVHQFIPTTHFAHFHHLTDSGLNSSNPLGGGGNSSNLAHTGATPCESHGCASSAVPEFAPTPRGRGRQCRAPPGRYGAPPTSSPSPPPLRARRRQFVGSASTWYWIKIDV